LSYDLTKCAKNDVLQLLAEVNTSSCEVKKLGKASISQEFVAAMFDRCWHAEQLDI